MEPASLIASIGKAAGICLILCSRLKEISEAFVSAKDILILLSKECEHTVGTLNHTEKLISEKSELLSYSISGREVGNSLDAIIGDIHQTVDYVQIEISMLGGKGKKVPAQLLYLVNEKALNSVVQRLRDQRSSVQFQINCIQTELLFQILSTVEKTSTTDSTPPTSPALSTLSSLLSSQSPSHLQGSPTKDTPMLPAGRLFPRKQKGHKQKPYDVVAALTRRDIAFLRKLLDRGVDPDTAIHESIWPKNNFQIYPVISCAQSGNLEMTDLLIQYGASLAVTDRFGHTGISCAAINNQTEAVKLFLDYGMNIDTPTKDSPSSDDYGLTPLMSAIMWDSTVETLQFLLVCGADLGLTTAKKHVSALHLAAKDPSTAKLKCILESQQFRKEFIDKKNADGQTALHGAAIAGINEALQLLVEHGADINEIDGSRKSALHHAVQKKHLPSVKYLLTVPELNLDLRCSIGWPASQYSLVNGDLPMVRLLQSNGVDLSRSHLYGLDIPTMSYLLGFGIKIDKRGIKGITALIWAAYCGNKEHVLWLLDLGADSTLVSKDCNGLKGTAAGIARQRGFTEIVSLIEKFELR